MKRRVGAVVVVLVLVAIAIWLWRGHGSSEASSAVGRPDPRAGSATAAAAGHRKADPRLATRGSISGAVHDEAGAAIAGAAVCAAIESNDLPSALIREPACTHTDGEGHYQIANLLPAEYTAHAAAKQYRFETYFPSGKPGYSNAGFSLAAGQARTGVDFVLRRGGVEVTGTVLDVTGGPIAHAQVRGSALLQGYFSPPAETDAQGAFSLWLDRGSVTLRTTADGYAAKTTGGRAPGNIEILLTPESTLAGSVVDAGTGQPVEGARVEVEGVDADAEAYARDITDEQGKFRVGGLTPGRFTAEAFTDQSYGKTSGSTLLGLGQHVDGVIIKVFPAHRISGTIVVGEGGAPVRDCRIALLDSAHDRYVQMRRDRDQQVADGVRPGTYRAEISCENYVVHDAYDPITVANADVTGVIWRVDAGATIRGKVLSKAGAPIGDAQLWVQHVGGDARGRRASSFTTSKPDGSFELTGVKAGSQRLQVGTDKAVAPREGFTLTVAAGATLEHDVVLDDGGKLTGSVVDDTGAPVAGAQIATLDASRSSGGSAFTGPSGEIKSAADGTFTLDSLRAGDYQVTARRSWSETLRKPGTTDDAKQGEHVTIHAGQTATVRLVVESQRGTITGSVIDTAGQPISDAFVSWSHESDAAGAASSNASATRNWWNDQRPVVTGTDGRFTLTGLARGAYTLRAYRRGGGEAIAEHIAVGTTATLQIKPTGSIAGTAHRNGGPPDELSVRIADHKTGFARDESFYMTAGQFSLTDLPAGHFIIDINADKSHVTLELDLAEGEAKTGLEATLEALVDVTGRLVDAATHQPVAGVYLYGGTVSSGQYSSRNDGTTRNVSDQDGRFTLAGLSAGELMIAGFPQDYQGSSYAQFSVVRTASAGTGDTIDIGDVEILKRRVKPGDKIGELGLHFAQQSSDTLPAQREWKISWIDPAGPAAKTALQLGDVIISIDGTDVSGANFRQFATLSRAPPGTTLSIGTQRGPSVQLVLAAP